MSANNIVFSGVSFSYNGLPEPVITSANFHFSKGWTGITGPNGAGKSTVAKLAAGLFQPSSGFIIRPDGSRALYCTQDTEYLPENSRDFLHSIDSDAGKFRSLLEIDNDWDERWNTLSHGERKRMQVASALWSNPEILILDEPVNHIDLYARELLLKSLMLYEGIGILVSHDRNFMDSLCNSCLFISSGKTVLRRGTYSQGVAVEQHKERTLEKQYSDKVKKFFAVKKKAAMLKQSESSKKGKLSKKNISRHDHDAKVKIDAARLIGKDKTGAGKVKLMEKRRDELESEAASLYFQKQTASGITFAGEKAKSDFVASIARQIITPGANRELFIPDLKISPDDRIGITGKNGSGKSTFIRNLLSLINLKKDKIIYIPQEIDENLWAETEKRRKTLNNNELAEVISAVHRLGSDTERVMFSQEPSPGEKRKIILATGLLKNPSIIVLDEPTNHMDIESIKSLEEALGIFTGAIVIVSHDIAFMKKTVKTVWEIREIGNSANTRRFELLEKSR